MSEQDRAAPWELTGHGASEHVTQAERDVIALFNQSRSPLLRYLLSLGLRVQEAEEVVQEGFLALFEHLQAGKSRRNLRGWIFRVCHNLGLKRRLEARRQISSAEADEVTATRRDPAENPEQQVLNAQRHQRLQAILRALPERDRWCLALRAEGLSYREIAQALEISLGSVAASLAHSLERLSRADA